MRRDVACSVGIKWAGAFWPLMDRSIDDDENGQDSTRVMNSLVWFDLIVIPHGKAEEGKGRKAFDPSHPHPATHPASKFELRMKQSRKVLLVCPRGLA